MANRLAFIDDSRHVWRPADIKGIVVSFHGCFCDDFFISERCFSTDQGIPATCFFSWGFHFILCAAALRVVEQ